MNFRDTANLQHLPRRRANAAAAIIII